MKIQLGLLLLIFLVATSAHAVATDTPTPTPTLTISLTATITPTCTAVSTPTPLPTQISGELGGGKPVAYPDPASSNLTIAFPTKGSGSASLRIFNSGGDPVALLKENVSSGYWASGVDVSAFSPGVYLYDIEIEYDDGNKETMGLRKFRVKR